MAYKYDQDAKTAAHAKICEQLCELYEQRSKSQLFSSLYAKAGMKLPLEYISCQLNDLEAFVLSDPTRRVSLADPHLRVPLTEIAYSAVATMVEILHETPFENPAETIESRKTEFRKLLMDMNALYDRKNRDYNDSFGRGLQKYGILMSCIRLSDKMNRLVALTVDKKERKVSDESANDTLTDFANYTILTLVEMDLEEKE